MAWCRGMRQAVEESTLKSSQSTEPTPRTQPAQPRFLAVRIGDRVAVAGSDADWWIGDVIHAEGGARCGANSLFQIACVDSGVIRTINADAVFDILQSQPPATDSGTLQPAHDHPHQQQRTGQSHQQGDRHEGFQRTV